MKALEILKKIYINNPDTRFQRNNIDINFTIHDFSNVNEAIKELEALENRSCEGCKSFQFWSETKDISSWDSHWIDLGLCNNGVQSGCFNSTVDKDFCCNGWESK